MFYIMVFLASWVLWLLFADKSRWRELFPVSLFASLLGALTDCVMHHYKLWDYPHQNSLLPELLDDFGVYMVVTYLFIQWLPKKKTFRNLFGYWVLWTGFTVGTEWMHVATNHMVYFKWWSIGCSFIADWILFVIFYMYHQIFRFQRLNDIRP